MLRGVAIEIEDSRCKGLFQGVILKGVAIEIEDSRCKGAAVEMEDPRCSSLRIW
jgi:hypothetical protein